MKLQWFSENSESFQRTEWNHFFDSFNWLITQKNVIVKTSGLVFDLTADAFLADSNSGINLFIWIHKDKIAIKKLQIQNF